MLQDYQSKLNPFHIICSEELNLDYPSGLNPIYSICSSGLHQDYPSGLNLLYNMCSIILVQEYHLNPSNFNVQPEHDNLSTFQNLWLFHYVYHLIHINTIIHFNSSIQHTYLSYTNLPWKWFVFECQLIRNLLLSSI